MMRRPSFPNIVLAASMLLSAAATAFVWRTSRERDGAHFQNAVASARDRVAARLDLYTALLRSTAAYFVASDTVSRGEFREYVRRLAPHRQYRGIQGIGFTLAIRADELAAVERAIRARDLPDFRVWPAGARDEYTAILYLEPADRRNRVAIGFDMASEATRREAMVRARDGGRAALSGRVELVQEIDAQKQSGFLLYVPVFDAAQPPATVEARRRALRGWVYAPFRAGDMFAGIFGSEEPLVRMRVYDGTRAAPEALLYDSEPRAPLDAAKGLVTTRALESAGRRWTIEFRARDALLDGHAEVPLIAVVGSVISLVLFALARAQSTARRRAESSEAARGQFYAAMSHELRTPLNAIIGYNDLLLADIYGPLARPQGEAIARSQRAARHLLELVNDVLDLSKLEAGKMEVSLEPVRVPDLVEDLGATVRPMLEAAGARLEIRCEPGLPTLTTDPRRVRQVLLNLLSNAAKFAGGEPVEMCCAPTIGGAAISVRDRGPGIAPEDQERVFDEFVQLDGGSGDGTGLGLPISRRLAALLGGRLELESAPGQGSTFRLVLPTEPRAGRGA